MTDLKQKAQAIIDSDHTCDSAKYHDSQTNQYSQTNQFGLHDNLTSKPPQQPQVKDYLKRIAEAIDEGKFHLYNNGKSINEYSKCYDAMRKDFVIARERLDTLFIRTDILEGNDNRLIEIISALDAGLKETNSFIQDLDKRINDIAKDLEAQDKLIGKIIDRLDSMTPLGLAKTPHKCRVCDGCGSYTALRVGVMTSYVCNTCEGKGIVWG